MSRDEVKLKDHRTVWCPDGHHNPPGFEFCAECGARIEETDVEVTAWYRTKWALIGASGVVALVILAATVVFAIERSGNRLETGEATSGGHATIPNWWADAHTPVTQLRQSIADARDALGRMDSVSLKKACQQMHDAAGVEIHGHLPAPIPDLSSDLAAAAEDAHAAAHMCLSLAAGSQNTYNGEFLADLQQADRRLVHAEEIVNEALLRDR